MRFSIITITRNHLAGLQDTQKSLMGQSCTDYEWIVIDGASTDGTADFLGTLRTGPVLPRWISEPDCGIYDAMNKGLERASGDYILFLNAGDTFAAADVLDTVSALEADFIYGDSREGAHYKRARPQTYAVAGMFTHHQAMFYKRALIKNLRFDRRYKIAADYKFTLEFLKRAKTVLYWPGPVCCFAPGGVSQVQARAGRREQFCIRRDLNACPALMNIAILQAQCALMALRRGFPGLYWWLKRAHNSGIQ